MCFRCWAGIAAGLVVALFFPRAAWADEPAPWAVSKALPSNPMTLELDARSAERGLMVAHLVVPAAPGPFTLVYPEWIPGEHGPTGPLNDVADLQISGGGAPLAWQRDLVDLYAFHVNVPAGVNSLDVTFNVLLNASSDVIGSDVMSSANIAIVNWNRVLLYQQGTFAREVYVKPSIVLPDGWDYGTALPDARRDGNRISFDTVSLETLVDSPLDCGRFVKHVLLWSSGSSLNQLDLFGDRPQDLDFPQMLVAHYQRVVQEALAMYGARHWNNYHFLLTLSDAIGVQGIEHHQSSDDREHDDYLSNDDRQLSDGDLLTHEFSHSWNGKYRRPADLATPNYQVPMKTDLLWVYEGLNQYLGDVLSFRSGIREPKLYPEYVAATYASLDTEPGRESVPLIDTAVSAPWLYTVQGPYTSLRRSTGDFYAEGELIWLDADTIIRSQTGGAKSLDDFLHAYAGPPDTGPQVVPYTREDIEHLLSSVAPYDWHGFFQRSVYSIALHPPTDEIERSGWRLVYNATPNTFIAAGDRSGNTIDAWYSLGLNLQGDGTIDDVRSGSPAWKARLAPGMGVVAINGQAFSQDVLNLGLKSAQASGAPIAVLVKHNDWYRTYQVDYHGGPRYPHLERLAQRADMLAKITAPHAR